MISTAAFPRLAPVRQLFPDAHRIDIEAILRARIAPAWPLTRLAPGSRVALAVGSRGIVDLPRIVRGAVDGIRAAGHRPFLIPAMGSHGGATPEGQLRILADVGIDPETLGLPVEPAMETTILGATPEGIEVHCATAAVTGAGAIILINRIKPHTDFGGPLGSGLLKMTVVGLGKHNGALAFHRAASRFGYAAALRAMFALAFERLPLLGGIAVIEDQRHQTARVEFVPAARILAREEDLVAEAGRLMPALPVDDLDLLIVDRLGKNISGAGMDPNVVGRTVHGYSLLESEMHARPRIRRLFVRELTPESHGNAIGIGLADFTTTRLVRAIDKHATYTNSVTALSLQGAKIPVHFDADREAIAAAFSTLGASDPRVLRVARILDTLSLEHLVVSEACLPELDGRTGVAVLGPPEEMRFDPDGNLA